ncbi:hypothetical protein KC19_1G008800 [Ceratodon purpureus]|uniref:BRCT domain-containing protein n=1 Tax=Ceratodon purpureus TaxID=3225 RepID=A0A8T0J3D6_CERPU|nr:hypothetical protein KC19_1G008800 [Ceratodon purpureus]
MSLVPGMALGRREGGLPFQGLRVYLPRNYVPPERYSALQDALTHQGAEVFLNLNPHSKSNLDYHVLADELKIKDMVEKGCRVVGPECVLRCAREFKRLPDREYTCCLALEGVSVLLTGFIGDEKKELEDLVTSMHGTLLQQTVPDVDFVVAKDVRATKYKWACDMVRKPILISSWLRQCAREHRQIPHDSYRMPPLAGLIICATGIMFEDRYLIQAAAEKNGAAYHSDLTRECSHLIARVPDGPKYVAAINWGLKVVTQDWFWESVKHNMNLDETLFPVVLPTVPDTRIVVGAVKRDVTTAHDQRPSPSPPSNNEVSGSKEKEPDVSGGLDAERRQSIGDAMYLSGCRIFLTGFSVVDMRKLVNLVLAGGGTRHMEMNDTITHVILGSSVPESGMKEIRQLAMWGAVYILEPGWLEECTRQRREVSIDRYRVPQNLLLQSKDQGGRVAGVPQSGRGGLPDLELGASSAKANGTLTRLEDPTPERTGAFGLPGPTPLVNKLFSGLFFGFTNDYPADQRAEVVRRVLEHGGVWEANASSAEYVLAPHGVLPVERTGSTMKYVSKYWISWCIEEGKLLDVQSHTLFRPLSCQIPLADFQGVKFCVSQYSERDRRLLRKLCQVLRVKFTETLNSKVTHLLCKVQAGEKYENAERLGIPCVTADWLHACAAQNTAVPMDPFQPREPTAAEKEAEHTFMTQRPVRAGQLPSHPVDLQTQLSNQSNPGPSQTLTFTSKSTRQTNRAKAPVRRNNRSSATSADYSLSSQALGTHLDPWDASAPFVAEAGSNKVGAKPSEESLSQLRPATGRSSLRPSTRSMQNGDGSVRPNTGERSVAGSSKAQELPVAPELDTSEADHEDEAIVGGSNGVVNVEIAGAVDNSIMDNNGSDDGTANVVDAIEGLLRQTSKVKGVDLVEVMEVHKVLISPETSTLSRRTREETHTHTDSFKKPKLYPNTRSSKVEGDSKSPTLALNEEDGLRFDESQLDSQMVAYDEDHSERQNLMERVRTRTSSMSLASNNSTGARQTDKSAAAWKGDQKLGRLFKAAEANK